MNKDLSFLENKLIAHRGMFNRKLPENSIGAFKNALKNNYIIELDLHLLKDGNIVVFHDDDLKRMTGVDKKLKNLNYNDIKKLHLNNTIYNIPLFSEVLELVNGKVPLIIEFKTDNKAGLLEEKTMQILKNYKGKYVVHSFNPFSVIWFKNNYPEVIRGQLINNFKNKSKIFKILVFNNIFIKHLIKPDFLSISVNTLSNKKIQKYTKNYFTLCWTIRNIEDMKKAKTYCNNIICENLDIIDK